MPERLFTTDAFTFFGIFAALAFLTGLGYSLYRRDPFSDALTRAWETATMSILGGFLARSFIGLLLFLADDSPNAILAISWGFFLWPGALESAARLVGEPLLQPQHLMGIAAAVGSFVGMADGLWQVHKCSGPIPFTFLIDVTWGLAGSTNGALFHIANFIWGGHEQDGRKSGHRYKSGFRLKSGFAVTQGSVMSNMGGHGPGSSLYKHEMVHVLQNRIFGPLFVLTYLGWMAVWLLPAFLVGLIAKSYTISEAIQGWCYFNNPWEVWAYKVGGYRNINAAVLWSTTTAVVFAVLFFLPVLGLAIWTAAAVWG